MLNPQITFLFHCKAQHGQHKYTLPNSYTYTVTETVHLLTEEFPGRCKISLAAFNMFNIFETIFLFQVYFSRCVLQQQGQ